VTEERAVKYGQTNPAPERVRPQPDGSMFNARP
jgi:hypothetical protein